MITTREAAKLFIGKGALDHDKMQAIIYENTGEVLTKKRVQNIKQNIDKSGYIESTKTKVGSKSLIEVVYVGYDQHDKKKRQTNKLKTHFRKYGKKHDCRHYAEKFGLSRVFVYKCWREIRDELSLDLYSPEGSMKLINEVWR